MKEELGRRGFLEVTGAMAVPMMAGVDWDEHALGLDDRVEGFGILLGPKDARPPADGEYFGQWDTYRFMYFADDTGEVYFIQTDDASWSALVLKSSNFWSDADANNLLEADGYDGIEVADVVASKRQHGSGSFAVSGLSMGQETVTFADTYDPERVTNVVGFDITGGLSGNLQATWAGYTTDGSGNITGMDISYRNETSGSEDVVWEVDGWAP